MIIFIYGTTAEAIKIAPVARRLTRRGIPFEQWLTNQHAHELAEIMPALGLPSPTRIIVDGIDGEPVKTVPDTLRWISRIFRWLQKNKKPLRESVPEDSVIVVHGDTITTVLGAYIARALRVPCAHIEAGLRSGSWRHPFPEELDRMIVGKLAQIHYTPSQEAVNNLRGKENVVFTHGNTAIDAILDHPVREESSQAPYGVLLLHRFEFLNDRDLVRNTLETIQAHAPCEIRFFADGFGQQLMNQVLGESGESKLNVQPKLPHDEFANVLRNADFVITDSGGIQAECALLGVPTLIHRKTTEQKEGLGENILLSNWEMDNLVNFFEHHSHYRRAQRTLEHSPSEIIVDDLVRRGFSGKSA